MSRVSFHLSFLTILASAFALLFVWPEDSKRLDTSAIGEPDGPEAIEGFFSHWFGELGFPMSIQARNDLHDGYLRLASEALPTTPSQKLGGSWQYMGPEVIQSGEAYSHQSYSMGRVAYFEDLPGYSRYRVAAPTGGLWEVDQDPGHPVPLSDTIEVPFGLVAGAFATDPTNEDVIILGSGVFGYANGSGLWRTVDRGANWTLITVSANPYYEPTIFYRIRFDPSNPSRVHLATDKGYWLSTDGGLSYDKKLDGSETDIAFIPSLPNVVYTANATAADSSGIYFSDNNGDTFVHLVGGGVPAGDVRRTSIAVGPTEIGGSPTKLYVSVDRVGGPAIYSSVDGANWNDITPANTNGLIRGNYNNAITADPIVPGYLLVGWVNLYWSIDDGASWQIASGLHSDFHALGWDDEVTLIVGNDAGLQQGNIPGPGSTDFNWLAPTWYPIAQLYESDVSPSDGECAIFGMQDNGIATTRRLINDGGYSYWARGGDAGSVALDPICWGPWWAVDVTNAASYPDPDGLNFRNYTSKDLGVTFQESSSGIQPSLKFIRHVRSPRVPAQGRRIVTYSEDKVYGSTDAGQNWTELNVTPFDGQVQDLSISDTVGDNVWAVTNKDDVGFNERILYRSSNGTWFERSQTLPNKIQVVRIAPADPYGNRPDEVYALIGPGTSTGAAAGNRLFFTDDAGLNWQNLTGNLPAELPIFDLIENWTNPDILYLATAAGVLRTTDRGITWVRWNNGWPEAVIVTRMIVNYPDYGRGFLYATTYGRGMWRRDISDDMTISTGAPEVNSTSIALRVRDNPAYGDARFEYELPKAAPVSLEIYDLRGRLVRRLETSGLVGVNQLAWAGRDEHGRIVGNGVYFAVLRTPVGTTNTRFVLTR